MHSALLPTSSHFYLPDALVVEPETAALETNFLLQYITKVHQFTTKV